jgi:hypothetical protein
MDATNKNRRRNSDGYPELVPRQLRPRHAQAVNSTPKKKKKKRGPMGAKSKKNP